MNTPECKNNVLVFSNPEAMLGSPEVAKVTRGALKKASVFFGKVWKAFKEGSAQGARIHRDVMRGAEERYIRNADQYRGFRGLL